jgi:hypothetical protein
MSSRVTSSSRALRSAKCSGVVAGRTVVVRLENGRLETSFDSAHWTNYCALRRFFRDVTYANALFVAVGGSYFDEPGVIITLTGWPRVDSAQQGKQIESLWRCRRAGTCIIKGLIKRSVLSIVTLLLDVLPCKATARGHCSQAPAAIPRCDLSRYEPHQSRKSKTRYFTFLIWAALLHSWKLGLQPKCKGLPIVRRNDQGSCQSVSLLPGASGWLCTL